MIGEIWRAVVGYLEKQPYWARLQPVLLFGFVYVGVAVTVHQYVQWQYGLAPSPPVFLRSYLFRQVTIIMLAVGAALLILRPGRALPPPAEAGWRGWLAARRALLLRRGALLLLVLLAAAVLWLRLASTAAVADVRLKLEPPGGVAGRLGFDPVAFAYLAYELNRQQRSWHLEIDLDPFEPDLLSSRDRARCAQDGFARLCLARAYATALPEPPGAFILVTGERFETAGDRYYYWLHEGGVSVISAGDWQREQPSIYDYLAYAIVLQAILIHLDQRCPAFAERHAEGRVTRGELFEFQPTPQLMPAAILAAHLSRPMEELLFNCFGPAYAADAGRLLSLGWLHAETVQRNLKLLAGPRPPG
ncbi:MAG: hypothetical protein U1E53_27245 [Dongiaceae bacterium]